MKNALLFFLLIPSLISAQGLIGVDDSVLLFEKELPQFEIVFEDSLWIHKSTYGGYGYCDSVERKLFQGAFISSIEHSVYKPLCNLNHNGAQAHPWISANGLRIYYTDEIKHFDYSSKSIIYVAERVNREDEFKKVYPLQLPEQIENPLNCHLSADEKIIYVVTSQEYELWKCERSSINDPFTRPVKIEMPVEVTGYQRITLSEDEETMYLVNGNCVRDRVLLKAALTNDNSFEIVDTIDLPSDFVPGSVTLSKEEDALFIGGDDFNALENYTHQCRIIKYFLNQPIPSIAELDFLGPKSSDKTCFAMPSVSAYGDMVLVLSNGCWWGDDLHFVPGNVTLDQTEILKPAISIFPNPATNQLTNELSNAVDATYSLMTVDGRLLREGVIDGFSRLDLVIQDLQRGYYFVVMNGNGFKNEYHPFVKN